MKKLVNKIWRNVIGIIKKILKYYILKKEKCFARDKKIETDVNQVENGEAFCPTVSDQEQASLPCIFSTSRFVSNR